MSNASRPSPEIFLLHLGFKANDFSCSLTVSFPCRSCKLTSTGFGMSLEVCGCLISFLAKSAHKIPFFCVSKHVILQMLTADE